jgi:menaquinone-9 beta-reductase
MVKPVVIIGGGLAGLTLGIGLRQRHVPVIIHEAGQYPRHRVCGEFISGRGQATLERLKLLELIERSGAVISQTAAFFSTTRAMTPRPLPFAGICLSRFTLDAALANKFRALDGELHVSSRREDFGEGIVRASGRRPGMDENGSRWFGLKIHARKVDLSADLEMHVSPRGYVGLCKINGGAINVCGLFRKTGMKELNDWRKLLCGQPDSLLHHRLRNVEFAEDSYCAVAGLSLTPQSAAAHAGVSVGDAITMIPPITGNGMSMAFESAELAIEPLVAWSRGESSWTRARRRIAHDCDALFTKRLTWAKCWQHIILTPALQNPAIALAARSQWLWRMAFNSTR